MLVGIVGTYLLRLLCLFRFELNGLFSNSEVVCEETFPLYNMASEAIESSLTRSTVGIDLYYTVHALIFEYF